MLLKWLLAAALLLGQTGNLWAAWPPMFQPPKRYDHPYRGKLIVKTYGAWGILRQCGYAWACTYVGGDGNGRCTVHVMAVGRGWLGQRKVDVAGFRLLVNHERGHCNGWPANHPR